MNGINSRLDPSGKRISWNTDLKKLARLKHRETEYVKERLRNIENKEVQRTGIPKEEIGQRSCSRRSCLDVFHSCPETNHLKD